MPVESFHGPADEQRFETWRTQHPAGFFINSDDQPSERYIVLHRANCSSIESGRRTTYRKTCGDTLAELRAWLENAGLDPRTVSDRCPSCNPPTI